MARSSAVAIPRDNPADMTYSTSASADKTRWQLVLARTPATGFLYGVVSTHIFCRPSCPSRRPRRANVQFFDSAAKAVAAGFRACRRCRPESEDPSDESPQASAEKQVAMACKFVRQRKGDVQLFDLAAHVGLSPRYFHGLFKQIVGITPGAYAASVKQKSTEQLSAPVTPAPLLSNVDGMSRILDQGDATDIFSFASIDVNSNGWSPDGSDQVAPGWFSKALDSDLGFINFGQGESMGWLDGCGLEMLECPATFLEPIETMVGDQTPEFVNPSMLGSSGSLHR
ncbi:hypothetical protein F5Y19DRAFT_223517 [Xylariaceae sp. FL1651]|nr:hypothetical protein F5Y19DRAFT_223517 [Xylariaceae sp. FL1651]